MTTITISIPDGHLRRLQEIADRFGIRIDELVLAGIEQLLSQPDETFHKAVNLVLRRGISSEKVEYALDYHAIFTKVNGSTRAFCRSILLMKGTIVRPEFIAAKALAQPE